MYKVFTRDHDLEIHARDHFPNGAPEDIQRRISLLWKRDHDDIEAGLKRAKETLSPMISEIAKRKDPAPIFFLVDCSGSMRGSHLAFHTEFLNFLFQELDRSGIPFEVLGHTTRSWKGGSSRKDYIDFLKNNNHGFEERNPGRLCDLLHVVFKSVEEPWTPGTMSLMHVEGFLKENLDGEAIEWAAERIRSSGRSSLLIHVGDGMPVDDSTLQFNPADILQKHRSDVIEGLRRDPSISFESIDLLCESELSRDGKSGSGISAEYGNIAETAKAFHHAVSALTGIVKNPETEASNGFKI